jgi:hypothetical protein
MAYFARFEGILLKSADRAPADFFDGGPARRDFAKGYASQGFGFLGRFEVNSLKLADQVWLL